VTALEQQLADSRKDADEARAALVGGNADSAAAIALEQKSKEVSALRSDLERMREELKGARSQAAQLREAAATAAAVPAKPTASSPSASSGNAPVADTEAVQAMQQQMQQLKRQRDEAVQNYQNLLRNSTWGAGTTPSASSGAQPRPSISAQSAARARNVDIQLVGAVGVGKSWLLQGLIKACDPAESNKFEDQRSNLIAHYTIKVGGRPLKILDCSGNPRASRLVKEWFGKTKWVVVVYDLCSKDSLNHAISELLPQVAEAGAQVVLFGNKGYYHRDKPEVNLNEMLVLAKDAGAKNRAFVDEGDDLNPTVSKIMSEIASSAKGQDYSFKPENRGSVDMRHSESSDAKQDPRRGSVMDSVTGFMKSMLGANPTGTDKSRRGNEGVLRPSLKGPKSMRQTRPEAIADLRPVQKLHETESAITCICFGQERIRKAYILLVAASKDGNVVVYRCYRTEMEQHMLAGQDFQGEEGPAHPTGDHSNIAVHSRLMGHTRAITSCFFSLLEEQLVTTSIDKSVRFWQVDTGEMVKVFTDSSPIPVAAFLPFNPQVFVAANSNAVLRLVNVQNGGVLQKLKVETEVRSLKFDDTGLFLLAGTKNGSIHVLEASDSSSLKFKFKVQLARGGVTCITFVPARADAGGQSPPCLLVNTADSSVTIIDCTYGPPAGVLTNLTVRHRVKVAHSLLPLKCCYSPSGPGYLISGSEDNEVYIYSLARTSNYKMQFLKHHEVPVVAVAVNQMDTLLASADSLGQIVLWRRMDFSHIAE